MGLTLSQAAEQTGKSKSVLSRAIDGGKISAGKREDGSYDIDPVELDRWFKHVARNRERNPLIRTRGNQENTIENKVLEAQLNAANEQKEFWRQRVEDMKRERDDWKQQAQTLLLSPPQPESSSNEQTAVITLPALPVSPARTTEAAKPSLGSWIKNCPLWSKKRTEGNGV